MIEGMIIDYRERYLELKRSIYILLNLPITPQTWENESG